MSKRTIQKPASAKKSTATTARRATRREFVKTTAALGVGFWAAGGVLAKPSRSVMNEIRFGCIGVGGKGESDSADANNTDQNRSKIVAICDIDEGNLSKAAGAFPGARKFYDFRKMLEEMDKSIDAVTVSTPDHTHAVASLMAMRMGKHCFCQKPMTHSIEEARLMADVAREKKLVTQMGNQLTADSNLRLSAALIRAGHVGTVKEVHVWTNRPVWPQSYGLKVAEPPVPDSVHWDLWIGPAKKRSYSPEIHPFKWRGFWDFGTGALGDMACHTLNMAFMALDLRNPVSVQADSTKHDGITYPEASTIRFEFPEYNGRPALTMYWYDGKRMPPRELTADCPKQNVGEKVDGKDTEIKRTFDSGALVIGDKGKFFSPGDYGGDVANTGIIVDGKFTNQRRIDPDIEYVKSPGHFTEFTNAIRGEGKAMSNFPDYAGPLTETVLLGNLSVWSGKKIEWDAANMRASGADASVEQMIRHEYHNGFNIRTA